MVLASPLPPDRRCRPTRPTSQNTLPFYVPLLTQLRCLIITRWWPGVVVSALASINKVNQCRARLVLRWVNAYPGSTSDEGHLSRYVASHPGQLSLDISLWVGAMSTSQRVVMPCGWGVKVGMVHVWVAGDLCVPLVTYGPYLSALAVVFPIIRRYTNHQITLLLLLLASRSLHVRISVGADHCYYLNVIQVTPL